LQNTTDIYRILTADLEESELREMDCMTCHNRITHLVPMPADQVDTAISRGFIDRDIPDIRTKAIEMLSNDYTTQEEGINGIAGLDGYYQSYYPDYYAANTAEIDSAVAYITNIYTNSVNWIKNPIGTPNNIGHRIHLAASAVTMENIWTHSSRQSAWNATSAIPSRWSLVRPSSLPISSFLAVPNPFLTRMPTG
jgi:hypothetical protein